MKSVSLISTGTLCLAMLSCSTAATAPSDTAGASNGGSSQATAGSGATANGGAGESTSTGGSTGGSSVVSMAGTATNGGSDTGTGGNGGTGGTETSTGGASGSGTAGSGGGSAGGSSACGTPDMTFVGAWDGSLMEYACGAKSGTGYDCPQPTSIGCKVALGTTNPASVIPPSNGSASTWTMGAGCPNAVYNVTFNVHGVVEVTSYIGGTRAAGSTSILANGGLNLFQQGGTPQVNGDPSYDYNTYEIRVTPSVNPTAKVAAGYDAYYLNAVMTSENPHAAGTPTTHHTYPIDYTAQIKVGGGGKVTMVVTDSNCVEVMNCGTTSSGNMCPNHSSVALTGTMPAAPADFVQPFTQPADAWGQWVYFSDFKVAVGP